MKIKLVTLDRTLLAIVLSITLLNLNGLAYMWIGVGQLFTAPLLLSAILLVSRARGALGHAPLAWFYAACIATYLSVAAVTSAIKGELGEVVWLGFDYVASIIVVFAVVGGAYAASRLDELRGVINLLWVLFIITCTVILISPWLYPFFVHVPASFEQRSSGAFANPNEAGLAALFAYGFALSPAIGDRRRAALLLGLALLAIVATYSKAAIIGAIGLTIFSLAWRAPSRVRVFVYLIMFMTFIGWSLIDFNISLPGWISDALASDQRRRAEQALALFAGDFGAETTTSRSDLWALGLDRIAESPLIGHGLGSFHALEGGLYTSGGWLGVHNTFLMFAGEGGLLPLLLLVCFLLTMFLRASGTNGPAARLLLVSAIVGLMATHGALGLRFLSAMLGVAIVLASSKQIGPAIHE